MECPVCSLPLVVVERKGIELDWCVNCHGLWFDADELALLPAILGTSSKVPDQASLPKVSSAERPRRCPRCHRHMEKVGLDDGLSTVIDRCPAGDGLWFDSGELGRAFATAGPAAAGGPGMVSFLGETFSLGKPQP